MMNVETSTAGNINSFSNFESPATGATLYVGTKQKDRNFSKSP